MLLAVLLVWQGLGFGQVNSETIQGPGYAQNPVTMTNLSANDSDDDSE